ncbi:hypothetical protein BV22DRAFT_763308 [Leucogyrophana mollusca]|uniref:Uncharacterized protein n=1 Tax=Leucogyrophana mollusca TaxID=85980 RepID=A0ACB8B650_9AGAM|nr:hypothetical protein BV22DRAFT_763308 [Leucogyrophana mollusca]
MSIHATSPSRGGVLVHSFLISRPRTTSPQDPRPPRLAGTRDHPTRSSTDITHHITLNTPINPNTHPERHSTPDHRRTLRHDDRRPTIPPPPPGRVLSPCPLQRKHPATCDRTPPHAAHRSPRDEA